MPSRRSATVMAAGLILLVTSAGTGQALAYRDSIAPRESGESSIPGRVGAWGNNFAPVQTVPADVQAGVTAIAAGSDHALALKDGRVIAWGSNSKSQIDVPVEAQSNVTVIDACNDQSAAVAAGRVVMWGSVADLGVPQEAQANVSDVSLGGWHVLALREGRVLAWGGRLDNAEGEATVPTEALDGVTAIAAGNIFSLALKDGKVLAWGRIGQPPPDAQRDIVAIAAGLGYAMALTSTGKVVAWAQQPLSVPAEWQSGVSQIAAGTGPALDWMAIKDGKLYAPLWPDFRIPPWTAKGTLAIAVGGQPWALVISDAASAPSAVEKLRVFPRVGSIRVTWMAPLDTGGPFDVTYEVRVGSGPWTATAETKVILKGTKGKPLVVSVRAVNPHAPGPALTVRGTPR